MLTVKQIEAAKPKEKPYRLLDANGLYLFVPASGKKVWQLRYKLAGKEKVMTVGKYPFMSLQEATTMPSIRERLAKFYRLSPINPHASFQSAMRFTEIA